ncbi:NlpC/P60 family protein [Desulfonatronospira sp.]|uniref:C40 family peptidase n=1 Tax=Desulfonatronospira sp. TaxID=1962951 RepID=UPI0025C1F693|nr:NlpC/P60 family protein [Desulfonatronospira sp.]
MLKQISGVLNLLLIIALLCSCALREPVPDYPPQKARLDNMQYSIQAGAFSVLDNAVSLMKNLEQQGLEAYYFQDRDGLYKVRVGNFSSRRQAGQKAEDLKSRGMLKEYFVVVPESYPSARVDEKGTDYVRSRLVQTAREFIGVPYKWGGSSPDSGFDCSGLTMVVYRHNGLDLPRVAARQYQSGTPVSRNSLQKGDLVFFDTRGSGKVTHVGIYTGNGRFIHAPSSGRDVTGASLSSPYFRSRYLGARSYL